MLAERLREDVEGKGIISQTEFRKRMGTDIAYMSYLFLGIIFSIDKVERKRGKLITLFVDLRAAFDSMNKRILFRIMRDRGEG